MLQLATFLASTLVLLASTPASCQQEDLPFSGLADLAGMQQSAAADMHMDSFMPWSGLSNIEEVKQQFQSQPISSPSPSPSPNSLLDRAPLLSRAFGTFGLGGRQSVTDVFQSNTADVDQGAAEQAAQEAASGSSLSTANLLPSGDADMIGKGLEDSFADLPEQEGQGWLENAEEPGHGAGRWLDFWRLRATDMEELITPKGYPAERHKVLTRDGFILTNFRIPYGRDGPDGTKKPGSGVERQPVLLFHGISLSSSCWVINDPHESLAFILADEGYDVWMMNTRGNTFSREHEEYSDSNPRFWQFSLDEFARADLPASITYIKRETGARKVHVVGHSQGGTSSLAYLAWRPEAEEDVGVLLAVAPVVYATYLLSPTLVAFSRQANVSFASTLPPQEYLFVSGPMQAVFLGGLCQIPTLIPICTASTESMFGGSLYISTVQYQKYWKVWPSPTSYYNALHWGQMFNERVPKFMAFNYGPEYDLTKIRAPVELFTGGRDVLSTPQDMGLVSTRLSQGGSLAGLHETDDFSHMDYIWYPEAKDRIYGIIIRALNRHTDGSQ